MGDEKIVALEDGEEGVGEDGRQRRVVTGLAAAGREEEMARATLNAFGQDHLPGPLQQGTCPWVTRKSLPLRMEKREKAKLGAGGRVGIIGGEAVHGRDRRRGTQGLRARFKGSPISRILLPHQARANLIDCLLMTSVVSQLN